MPKNQQSGNVLFLILIAVALFAALSYAVTKSTSGGGNANSEKRVIDIATTQQQLSAIQTQIMRNNIAGIDTVTFNDTANGIYNPSTGISKQLPPKSLQPTSVTVAWGIYTMDVVYSGASYGTTNRDYSIVTGANEEACKAYNKSLHGDETIGTFTLSDENPETADFQWLMYDATFATLGIGTETITLTTHAPPACYVNSTNSSNWAFISVALIK